MDVKSPCKEQEYDAKSLAFHKMHTDEILIQTARTTPCFTCSERLESPCFSYVRGQTRSFEKPRELKEAAFSRQNRQKFSDAVKVKFMEKETPEKLMTTNRVKISAAHGFNTKGFWTMLGETSSFRGSRIVRGESVSLLRIFKGGDLHKWL